MKKLLIGLLVILGSLHASSDGALDPSFGIMGIVTLPEPIGGVQGGFPKNQVYVNDDGKIYFQADTYVSRFTSAGVVDTTFNGSSPTPGFVVVGGLSINPILNGMVVQPDGKIILMGSTNDGSTSGEGVIIRLNTDGSFDQTFNSGQPLITPSVYMWTGAALQEDSKIVVSGTTNETSNPQAVVARFNSNGTLDTSFGGTGIVTTVIFVAGAAVPAFSGGVAIAADQKVILTATDAFGSTQPLFVATLRYNSDGSLDTSFNASNSQPGVVIAGESVFPGIFAYQPNVIVQPDGKIIVGYWSIIEGPSIPSGIQVLRLNTDGSLDTSFNGSGFTTFFIQGAQTNFVQMLLQSDGRIIVIAEEETVSSGSKILVIRYTSSGQVDATFGSPNGFVEITAPSTNTGTPRGGALQQDGKILIGGFTVGLTGDLLLARLIDATPLI